MPAALRILVTSSSLGRAAGRLSAAVDDNLGRLPLARLEACHLTREAGYGVAAAETVLILSHVPPVVKKFPVAYCHANLFSYPVRRTPKHPTAAVVGPRLSESQAVNSSVDPMERRSHGA